MSAGHKKGDLEDYAQAIAFNLMSRVVGFLMRIVLIVVGLVALIVLFFGLWSFSFSGFRSRYQQCFQ